MKPLTILSLAIRQSVPPQSEPDYSTCWRCWWRIAIATMRATGIRSRAARDEVHRWLLRCYQDAATARAQEDAA